MTAAAIVLIDGVTLQPKYSCQHTISVIQTINTIIKSSYNYVIQLHRPSNYVITGLSITVALAAHGKPHPKSKHHHPQTDNHHILPRTSVTTLRGDAITTIS
jgi:hypothetical protein